MHHVRINVIKAKKSRWLADLLLTFCLQRERDRDRERNKNKKKYKYLKRKITKKKESSIFSLFSNVIACLFIYVLIPFPSYVVLSSRKQSYMDKFHATEKDKCFHCKFQSAYCPIPGLDEMFIIHK